MADKRIEPQAEGEAFPRPQSLVNMTDLELRRLLARGDESMAELVTLLNDSRDKLRSYRESVEFPENEQNFRTFSLRVPKASRRYSTLLRKADKRHDEVMSFVDRTVDKASQRDLAIIAGVLERMKRFHEAFARARGIPYRVPVADAAVGSTADSAPSSQDGPRRSRRTRRRIVY